MNGLTSIEVNGKSIGLKFGLEANQIFLEYVALHLERMAGDKSYQLKDIATLIYAGHVNFCTINDRIPEYSVGNIIGMLEDNYDELIQEIEKVTSVYAESKSTKRALSNLNNAVEDVKKKDSTDWEFIESYCYGELGLRGYKEFANLTLREFELMRLGYERKQEQTKELNLEAWRRARMTAFVSAKPHLKNQNLDVWEFMPLPGDPTERDLEQMKEAQLQESQKQIAEALQQYRSMGLEVPDIKFIA